MPRVIFTAHAKGKFAFFKKHKLKISRKQVEKAEINGIIIDITDFPKVQSAGSYNSQLSLITIYRKEGEKFIVITFWVAEKERYESKIQ